MGDAHGGVGGVDALPAGARGAEDVDADVGLGDVDVVGGLDERDDLDGGEGGLAAALVVEGADAHQAVRAALDAQGPVGVGGVDLEGDRLQARLLGVGGVEDLDGVVVPLGPAGVHAQEHLGEVGGVHASGARADGDDRIAGVVLAAEQRADL